MTENWQHLISAATKSLRLRDIALLRSYFERPKIPESDEVAAKQQTKHGVAYQKGEIKESDATKQLVQFTVELGTRVVRANEASESEDADIFFVIEASFLVEYELIGEVSDEALAAFADWNAVHNAWPFWRQHVFDIVTRGRLPHLEVPLFSGGPD